MKIRCLLLDDDELCLTALKEYSTQIPQLEIVGIFSNVMAAHTCLTEQKIDLLISDINMPMLDGLSFAKGLAYRPLIIFQTSHQEYAIESYEVEAVDFLVKPYSFQRFWAAIQKVVKRVNELSFLPQKTEEGFTFIKSDSDYIRVMFKDICYIEAYQNYVKVFTDTEMILSRISMRKVEEQFPSQFMRIHRSIIVNSQHIAVVKLEEVILTNGKSLTVGKNFYETIREKVVINHLLKG